MALVWCLPVSSQALHIMLLFAETLFKYSLPKQHVIYELPTVPYFLNSITSLFNKLKKL